MKNQKITNQTEHMDIIIDDAVVEIKDIQKSKKDLEDRMKEVGKTLDQKKNQGV